MTNTDGKIFEREDRLFKYFVNSSVEENNSAASSLIKDLVNLELITVDKTEEMQMLQVMDIVGFEKFCELVDCFNGKTIKLPRKNKFMNALVIAIAYYYINVLGKSAKETVDLLCTQLEIGTLKKSSVASRVKKLERDISTLAERINRRHGRN